MGSASLFADPRPGHRSAGSAALQVHACRNLPPCPHRSALALAGVGSTENPVLEPDFAAWPGRRPLSGRHRHRRRRCGDGDGEESGSGFGSASRRISMVCSIRLLTSGGSASLAAFFRAWARGVRPLSSWSAGSAPASSRVRTIGAAPQNAARCSGVRPCSVLAFGSAPSSSRAAASRRHAPGIDGQRQLPVRRQLLRRLRLLGRHHALQPLRQCGPAGLGPVPLPFQLGLFARQPADRFLQLPDQPGLRRVGEPSQARPQPFAPAERSGVQPALRPEALEARLVVDVPPALLRCRRAGPPADLLQAGPQCRMPAGVGTLELRRPPVEPGRQILPDPVQPVLPADAEGELVL